MLLHSNNLQSYEGFSISYSWAFVSISKQDIELKVAKCLTNG